MSWFPVPERSCVGPTERHVETSAGALWVVVDFPATFVMSYWGVRQWILRPEYAPWDEYEPIDG